MREYCSKSETDGIMEVLIEHIELDEKKILKLMINSSSPKRKVNPSILLLKLKLVIAYWSKMFISAQIIATW